MIELHYGDCLEKMGLITENSIDMILCDLPYGTTACKWDCVVPFKPLWEHYERIIKDNGAIVLTASQPFTSAVIMSNIKLFKYDYTWVKTRPSNHINAKNKPMSKHESVLVFSKGTTANCSLNKMKYYPQGLIPFGKETFRPNRDKKLSNILGVRPSHKNTFMQEFTNYPNTVLNFANPNNGNTHTSQKPVDLFEYLIRTYTNEGETVLDNCMGSGTTGVACKKSNRNFIGIEKDLIHFNNAKERIYER